MSRHRFQRGGVFKGRTADQANDVGVGIERAFSGGLQRSGQAVEPAGSANSPSSRARRDCTSNTDSSDTTCPVPPRAASHNDVIAVNDLRNLQAADASRTLDRLAKSEPALSGPAIVLLPEVGRIPFVELGNSTGSQ